MPDKLFIKSSAKIKADPDYYRRKAEQARKKLAALVPGRDDAKIADCRAKIEWAEQRTHSANRMLTLAVIEARDCPLCGFRAGMWCGFVGTREIACIPRYAE